MIRLWSIITLLLFLLVSCEGPNGPEGPKLTGKLTGFVTLVDQFGIPLTDHSGATVMVEETTLSTKTETSGKWTISDLSTGTYVIYFSKSGYGASKAIGYQFIGGGQAFLGTIDLAPIPDFNVFLDTLEVGIFGPDVITISGDISLSPPQNGSQKLRLFIGLDDSVSSKPEDYILTEIGFTKEANTKFITASMIDLTDVGIINSSGKTLYVVAYSSSGGNYHDSGYIDLETGRFKYTNLGSSPSDVMSVVIP